MSPEILEQDFTVPVPACLELSNLRGKVAIQPGPAGMLRISAQKHRGDGNEPATHMHCEQDPSGMVRAKTTLKRSKWDIFRFTRPCQVDYQVSIPPDCSIKLDLGSSSAWIEDLRGTFDLTTISGNISLHTLSGDFRLHSRSGAIEGNALQGTLLLDTVSGEISLQHCHLDSIRAETVSAAMDLHTPLGSGPYYFASMSGLLCLRLPADTRCTIDLHSPRGKLVSHLPVTSQAQMNDATLTDIQGGGVTLRMNSLSAGLVLKQA